VGALFDLIGHWDLIIGHSILLPLPSTSHASQMEALAE
jgi:hypothetical protein